MNQNSAAAGDSTIKTPTTTQNSNNNGNSNRGPDLKSPTTANNTNNSNSSNNSASSPTVAVPLQPRTPDQVTEVLRSQGAIPVTIQARAELLKDALPHNSWLPEYRWVVEGQQIGYALRLTGNDLVYVKFPIIRKNVAVVVVDAMQQQHQQPPSHLICVSFAVPKKFLVPVSTPTFPNSPAGSSNQQQNLSNGSTSNDNKIQNPTDNNKISNNNNNNNNNNNCVALTALLAEMTIVGKNGSGGAAAAGTSSSLNSNLVNNNNNNSAKPCLCVVCGVWNTDGGQMRKSGFKCKNCIGKQSTARLKEAYSKLATENDDE